MPQRVKFGLESALYYYLPQINYLTPAKLNTIQITNDDIVCVLKSLHPGKSNGPDRYENVAALETIKVPVCDH